MNLTTLLPPLLAALALFFGLRGRPPALRLTATLVLGAAAAVLAGTLPHEGLRWGFVLTFALLARALYPYSRHTDAPPAHGLDLPRVLWFFGIVLLLRLAYAARAAPTKGGFP
ncbi:hypothetical protein [Oceanithermus desulfurans]|uniref:Uncharacterized protein n=2 Tax=Oceanithermus desulfurans TaxID=227924 RepID=A0A511RMN4_9DEIN|nr:hypothetical protein [Oceanithermus desulfurans]MBB6030714.1 hypothetical protein [Oceanithermus desulfurans]GEM90357.1 hypothetical protein ODE01S_17910 [Oceanithermus desulfurans NBRC 100063]